MLDLLINAETQRQAFRDACLWATDIDLCLAWLAAGDAQGPSWSDVEPFLAKLRRAVVGLAHHRTDPALLRQLYDTSVLRLVPTTDEAFLANVYVFRRDGHVRCLLGSAPFSWTSFHRSIEHLFVIEGGNGDPLVARALSLVERGSLAAHVPTLQELESYGNRWEAIQANGHEPAGAKHSAEELFDDAPVSGLLAIPGPSADAQAARGRVIAVLMGAASRTYSAARLSNSDPPGDLIHIESLGLWAHLCARPPQGVPWASFGLDTPPTLADPSTIALSFTDDGQSSFAREPGSGRVFLVHKDVELVGHRRCGVHVHHEGGGDGHLAIIVGEVDAPDFPRHLAALARMAATPDRASPSTVFSNGLLPCATPSAEAVKAPNGPDSNPIPVVHAERDAISPRAEESPMSCPAITHFCRTPQNLRAVQGASDWSEVSRTQRRLAAEFSFVWREVGFGLEAALGIGKDSPFESTDLWDGGSVLIQSPTAYRIPEARKANDRAWLVLELEPVDHSGELRCCLTVQLANAAIAGVVRQQFVNNVLSSMIKGSWDSSGVPFAPPRETAERSRKSGVVTIAASDITNVAPDDLDEFVKLAVSTFVFGRDQAARINPAFAKFEAQ